MQAQLPKSRRSTNHDMGTIKQRRENNNTVMREEYQRTENDNTASRNGLRHRKARILQNQKN